MTGAPDSWGPNTAVSTKHAYYLSSTWSPCGQFIAVVANEAIEIWGALTLKLLSTLKPTQVATRFRHGLAYSPDGHSLAGCSDTAIIIWDTQTGGEVKSIPCRVTRDGLELVWSLDGKIIGAGSKQEWNSFTIYAYNVASGITLPPCTLQSINTSYFWIWAYAKSFRIATIQDLKSCRICIFETGAIPTEIESFPLRSHSELGAFSPTTYRISITGNPNHVPELLILDIHNSEVLLRETGLYQYLTFSPDGSFFAAFSVDHLCIWRYSPSHYTQQRKFQQAPIPLQFSPTLSSILSCTGHILHVLHLDSSPTALLKKPLATTQDKLLDAFSPDSTFIATAYHGGSTITITNLHSQKPFPSQFIDTELKISAVVLTGNVLIVKGPETLVAWLLTEKGVVDGIVGNTRADCNDSLWEISTKALINRWARLLGQQGGSDDSGQLEFSVEDGIGAIMLNESVIQIYHTETGEILKSTRMPLHLRSTWYNLQNEYDLYYHDLSKHHRTLEGSWPVSKTTLQEGWVKDPEGKHRLWLHGHWRSTNHVDWLHNATTLRLRNSSELVIIKF